MGSVSRSTTAGRLATGLGVLGALGLWVLGLAAFLALQGASPRRAAAQQPPQQPSEDCIVAVLNRTAHVQPNGTWLLPNVPTNMGPVRARLNCVTPAGTASGASALFTLLTGRMNAIPRFAAGLPPPTPKSLAITAPAAALTAAGQTLQLAVTADFPDGSIADVTAGSTGTVYSTTNAAIATVSANGLVTAQASGQALIGVLHEAILGTVLVKVTLSGSTVGDGIPDDWKVAHGLDPNDPAVAFEDPDHDGLTNLEEFQHGTDPHNPDTDGDGLSDGDEVHVYHTNPLLADTDGDGIPDGVEIQTGSDPLDPTSYNLAAAVKIFTVTPASFLLDVNPLYGSVASRQLVAQGELIDNKTFIDLTSTSRGTTYNSSDLTVCNFGATDGQVFAGRSGLCTITVAIPGHSAQAAGTVVNFTPTALSFVAIPGFANSVDVSGDRAYVAAGSAGLQVVAVDDRSNPQVIGAAPTAGNSEDVKVVGNLAYLADGAAGLRIFDVTMPAQPLLVGVVALPGGGEAQDLVVRGSLAYVADGSAGLQIVDVTIAAAPRVVGSLRTAAPAVGVDVAPGQALAAVTEGASGVELVSVADPTAPAVLGSVSTTFPHGLPGNATDVVLDGNFALVSDLFSSFTSIDVSHPAAPVLLASTGVSQGGRLNDLALNGSNLAFGADVFFRNAVPVTDVTDPAHPVPRGVIDFTGFRGDNQYGIAVDASFVYFTAGQNVFFKPGVTGDTRLYIGQYAPVQDPFGIPPTAVITSPAPGATVIQGGMVVVSVAATDDVGVAGVKLLVNGQIAAFTAKFPYQFTVPVPASATSLTLGAIAVDFADDTGAAPQVVVTAIPDPLTTAVGQVVDDQGNPVAGAAVTANGGIAGTTLADGSFSLAAVPTIAGTIVVTATDLAGGAHLSGVSGPAPPVLGDVTGVGTIVISAQAACVTGTLSFANCGVGNVTNPVELLVDAAGQLTPAAVITPDATGHFCANLRNDQVYMVREKIPACGVQQPLVGVLPRRRRAMPEATPDATGTVCHTLVQVTDPTAFGVCQAPASQCQDLGAVKLSCDLLGGS
jgi:hypothetical protein